VREILGTWGPELMAFSHQNPLCVVAAALGVTSIVLTLVFGCRGRATAAIPVDSILAMAMTTAVAGIDVLATGFLHLRSAPAAPRSART
jgi:hypothetical protein